MLHNIKSKSKIILLEKFHRTSRVFNRSNVAWKFQTAGPEYETERSANPHLFRTASCYSVKFYTQSTRVVVYSCWSRLFGILISSFTSGAWRTFWLLLEHFTTYFSFNSSLICCFIRPSSLPVAFRMIVAAELLWLFIASFDRLFHSGCVVYLAIWGCCWATIDRARPRRHPVRSTTNPARSPSLRILRDLATSNGTCYCCCWC